MPRTTTCPNPQCRRAVPIADDMLGKEIACPACGRRFRVPVDEPKAAVTAPAAVAAASSPPSALPAAPLQVAPVGRDWKTCFPLLRASGMLRPSWNVVPHIADCQSLGGEERLVKSYHIRVQRPKYPWILFFVFLILFNLSYAAELTPLRNELRHDGPVGFFFSVFVDLMRLVSSLVVPVAAAAIIYALRQRRLAAAAATPDTTQPLAASPASEVKESKFPAILLVLFYVLFNPLLAFFVYWLCFKNPDRSPPFVSLLAELSWAAWGFPQRMYGEEIHKFFDFLHTAGVSNALYWYTLVLHLAAPILLATAIHLGRKRGHTYLYLTNHRAIVLEVSRGLLGRDQTVLNYSLRNVAGFTMHAQRGLKKFLNLILLREKRTFYLSIITRTSDSFHIGAVNARRSQFDPGPDAVSLCSELDSHVLALKSPTATSVQH
jgi:hypothetical protein